MPLLLKTHFSLANDALKRNRGRSFLTCLGIAIGVASVILILSLMGSASRLITKEARSQDNLIIVRPGATHADTNLLDTLSTSYTQSTLTARDAEDLKNLKDITAAAPLAYSTNTLKAVNDTRTVASASVLATTPDLEQILNLKLKDGSFITNPETSDNNKNLPAPTAVIGIDLALELFGSRNPVGQTFTLLGEKFIVVGVLEPKSGTSSFDNTVLVPAGKLSTVTPLSVQEIYLKTSAEDKDQVKSKVRQSLLTLKNGDTNWTVLDSTESATNSNETLELIKTMLALVAGVSILIGGIGIMNIMLVAVAERTHEIGVRKALGATSGNIFLQFLLESLIISCFGGILGLILGYIFAFLVSLITPFPPFISVEILLAVLYISIISGTIFGLYPAIKASKKSPIDSLKSL